MNHVRLESIPPADRTTDTQLFSRRSFRSDLRQFRHVFLASSQSYEVDSSATETGYLVLDGQIRLEDDSLAIDVEAPAVVKCPVSALHRIVNPSVATAQILTVVVDLSSPKIPQSPSCAAESVDDERLNWRPAIHGGCGRIASRHIWSQEDFTSSWTFLDHAILERGSSVGYHHHAGLEESFVVLDGSGIMTIDGDTFDVGPGSVTLQGIEEGHGIYNPNSEPLVFLRVAVGIAGEPFTTVDLGDDLATREPAPPIRGAD